MSRIHAFLAIAFVKGLLCGAPCSAQATDATLDINGKEFKYDKTEVKISGDVLTLRPLIVPIIKQEDVIGYVMLTIVIACKKMEDIPAIIGRLPHARDELLRYLYQIYGILWIPNSRGDHQKVNEKLQEVAKKYFPPLNSISLTNMNLHILGSQAKDAKPFFVPHVAKP